VSALASLRGTTAAIAGPALAGICIATFGLPFTFGVNAAMYAVSLFTLSAIPSMPPANTAKPAGSSSIVRALTMRPADPN
jgi:hypothetical protein